MHVAYERRFGVEIECGLSGGTPRARQLFPGWRVSLDGSGVEVKTPPLMGKEGYATLRDAMDLLKAEGAFVTRSDGLHIHHDAPDFSPKQCLALVKNWRNSQDAIHKLVAPRRTGNNYNCPPWHPNQMEALELWAEGKTSFLYTGRNDLNLESLTKHGTVELRLHEGTLDADVAIAWIQFGQRFLYETLKRTRQLRRVESDDVLMSRIHLTKKAREILAAKKRSGHMTKATSFRYR